MTPTDRAALECAVEIARRDPKEAARIDARLAQPGADWLDIAKGCAFHCQIVALRLQPWQNAPMYGDVTEPRVDQQAAELLRRLLDAGLSRYEPDPIAALTTATGVR